MIDINIKRIAELASLADNSAAGQRYCDAGMHLGISHCSMNIVKMPPHWLDFPDREREHDGREEVYVVLEGNGVIQANGYNWQVEPGMLIRVGPAQRRKFISGTKGLLLLSLAGPDFTAATAKSLASG